jgi:hypothetical protein
VAQVSHEPTIGGPHICPFLADMGLRGPFEPFVVALSGGNEIAGWVKLNGAKQAEQVTLEIPLNLLSP